VRAAGVLLACASAAAAAACVRGMFGGRRPRDLGYALAAPVAILGVGLGLVLAFAPGSP
jgi:hypothetical protein